MVDTAQLSDHFVKWTEAVSAIGTVITCLIAVVGSIGALISYRSRTREINAQNRLNRFNNYVGINDFFEKNESVLAVRDAVEKQDWSNINEDNRYDFMSFYEQVALMLQSDLISESTAFYVYGYELMRAYNDPGFWSMQSRQDSDFWRLFHSFNARMERYYKRYSGQKSFSSYISTTYPGRPEAYFVKNSPDFKLNLPVEDYTF